MQATPHKPSGRAGSSQAILRMPPSPFYHLFFLFSSQDGSPPPWPQESAGVTPAAADLWGLSLGPTEPLPWHAWAAILVLAKGQQALPAGGGSGIVVLSLSPSTRALPF